MNIKDVIIVGIALAMDAVGVTISIGVNPIVRRHNKISFSSSYLMFLRFSFRRDWRTFI